MPATVSAVTKLPIQGKAGGINAADQRDVFYYVVTLSEQDDTNGASLAYVATGIPNEGEALGTTGKVCLRKRVEPESGDDSGINWRVTVEFGVNTESLSDGGTGEPWNRKDRIRRTVQVYEMVKSVDLDGKTIQNSARDPIPGLVFLEYNPVRIVNRWRRHTSFDPDAAEACIGTVNQGSFTLKPKYGTITIPAQRACLRNITTNDAVWTDGTFYFDITMELEIQGDPSLAVTDPTFRGVDLQHYTVQNKGFNFLDSADSYAKKPIMREKVVNGVTYQVPTPTEQFLKDDGMVLTSETPSDYDLSFRRRRVADWSGWIAT